MADRTANFNQRKLEGGDSASQPDAARTARDAADRLIADSQSGLNAYTNSTKRYVLEAATKNSGGQSNFERWASSGKNGSATELSHDEVANLLNKKQNGYARLALEKIDENFDSIARPNKNGKKVITEQDLKDWATDETGKSRHSDKAGDRRPATVSETTEKKRMEAARQTLKSGDVPKTLVDGNTEIKFKPLSYKEGNGYAARATYGDTTRGYLLDENKNLTAFEEAKSDGSTRFFQRDKNGSWYERPNGPNDQTGQIKMTGSFNLDGSNGSLYHLRDGKFDAKTHKPVAGSAYSVESVFTYNTDRNTDGKPNTLRAFHQEVASDGSSWGLVDLYKKEEKSEDQLAKDQKAVKDGKPPSPDNFVRLGDDTRPDMFMSWRPGDRNWKRFNRDEGTNSYSGEQGVMVNGKTINRFNNPEIGANGVLSFFGEHGHQYQRSTNGFDLDRVALKGNPIIDQAGKYQGFQVGDKSSVRFSFQNGATSGPLAQVVTERQINNHTLRTTYEPALGDNGHQLVDERNIPIWNVFNEDNNSGRQPAPSVARLFNVSQEGLLTHTGQTGQAFPGFVYDWSIGSTRKATHAEEQLQLAFFARTNRRSADV